MLFCLDLERERAHMAGHQVFISPVGNQGQLRVGGPTGPLLRPPDYGERQRCVIGAANAAQPQSALGTALARLTTVESGEAEAWAVRILALALAGAQESGPPLHETVILVARATGWSPDQLYAVEAAEVDRLARHLDQGQQPQWSRLLFADSKSDSRQQLEHSLAQNLLQRLASPTTKAPQELGLEPEPITTDSRPLDISTARQAQKLSRWFHQMGEVQPGENPCQTSLTPNPVRTVQRSSSHAGELAKAALSRPTRTGPDSGPIWPENGSPYSPQIEHQGKTSEQDDLQTDDLGWDKPRLTGKNRGDNGQSNTKPTAGSKFLPHQDYLEPPSKIREIPVLNPSELAEWQALLGQNPGPPTPLPGPNSPWHANRATATLAPKEHPFQLQTGSQTTPTITKPLATAYAPAPGSRPPVAQLSFASLLEKQAATLATLLEDEADLRGLAP